MRVLGIILITCLSIVLVALTQSINENPNLVVINSLSKQSMINDYVISGVITTSIDSINYSITNSVNISFTHEQNSDTYSFNLSNGLNPLVIKLIIQGNDYYYCEGNSCSKADLSVISTQRFGWASAITRINQLLSEKLIDLSYNGFKLVNNHYCDSVSALINPNSTSFIDYLVDGEVNELSVEFCLDRASGLPLESRIRALMPDSELSIIFKAFELIV